MVAEDKKEVSYKVIINVTALVALLVGFLWSYKVNEYRIGQQEIKLEKHCEWGEGKSSEYAAEVRKLSETVIFIRADVRYIKEGMDDLKKVVNPLAKANEE